MAERFWRKVDKGADDECWLWTGYCNSKTGYGNFTIVPKPKTRKVVNTHRVAYELTHGEIPEGLDVRHKCDCPPCVNPAHLELGTRKQNMEDAVERNRLRYGLNHPNGRLTDDEVREIRQRRSAGEKLENIAEDYGISYKTVSQIALGDRRASVA